MPSKNSRPARWMRAAGNLREIAERLQTTIDDITSEMAEPLGELVELQQEYGEWYDSMPDSLQSGATGELLSEIGNLDIPEEASLDNITEVMEFADTADQVQLPAGFGRD